MGQPRFQSRGLRIAHRFVPTPEIAISCSIDLGTASAVWIGLWLAADWLHPFIIKLGTYAVHVLILMAIWNPLQHMRRAYHQHVKHGIALVLAPPSLPGGPECCPACKETTHEDFMDIGRRDFACGFSMYMEDGSSLSACRMISI